MSRFSFNDLTHELLEVSREIIADARQQLNYYGASVYKSEIVTDIDRKLSNLTLIAELMQLEPVTDMIEDFTASRAANGNCHTPYQDRLLALLRELSEEFEVPLEAIQESGSENRFLKANLKKHRRKLLSMCRQGSRQWSLFQSI